MSMNASVTESEVLPHFYPPPPLALSELGGGG